MLDITKGCDPLCNQSHRETDLFPQILFISAVAKKKKMKLFEDKISYVTVLGFEFG